MRRIVFCTLIFALSLKMYSQNYVKNDSTLMYSFINIFEKEGIKKAIDYVYSTNVWISSDNSNIDSVKIELNNVISILGKYYGCDLIKRSQLSKCLITYSFVMRFDRQPLRFVFVLYKPKDDWRFQLFNYDSNITEEMQNSKNVTWDL